MDFHILGPIEAIEGDRPLVLGGSKQRALLGMFLLHANEFVSIDRLTDELWAGERREEAVKALQVAVSRLRKALEPNRATGADSGLLMTRSPGYELRLEPERIDAKRFEALADEGTRALAARDPHGARTKLDEALRLWRGPPLADLAYESFCQSEISRLEELRMAALEDRIAADLELGRHAELVGELRALVRDEPLRERMQAHLMLALYRSERQAEALEIYADARRGLVEQLGIEPSRQLRELHQAILEQDEGLDLAAPAEPAQETTPGAFVGRESELAELVGALDEAFAGRGRVCLLTGEPGIGKSRLAEELIAQARARGARVLVGRCWEAGGAPAYWPWVQSLRTYLRETDAATLRSQLGAGATDLAQIVPELHQRYPDLPELPVLESEGARFRLFDAAAEFLRNASEDRPILLALDDLHAADAPSLLLLRFLARELGSMRILVLGAYRDVDPTPRAPLTEMLAEVVREPVTRRLSLTGLSEHEVEEYVGLMASEIAPPELLAGLHEETEGNPLFVGEIVRLLAVEGVPAETADLRFALPQSVRDVIERRLTHLSHDCNRVLVLASVIGREFALDALARLGAISLDELLDVLDEAMAARVVSELPGAPGRLRFAHVLIRDALYEGLTSARRLRLHRQAVEALEALYGDQPGPHLPELAHHAVAGGDFEKGCGYARQAAARSLELLAYEEAARLYSTALEADELAERPDEEDRVLSLGEAEARAGNNAAAKAVFLEAADMARRLGLPRELARAAAGYGGRWSWGRAGDDATLVPLLEEGLASLTDEDVELRTRLLARLAGALRDEPSRDRRDELSREAVDLARRTGNPVALANALDGRAGSIVGPDTVAECLAIGAELRDVAERISDRERMMDGHFVRLIAYELAGDVSAAEVELDAASAFADELGQPTQLWQVCTGRAIAALGAGRLRDADELVERALALGERTQPAEAIPVYTLQRYALCDLQGRLDEVEPALRKVVADYPARPMFRCALAHLHARLGRRSEAERTLDDLGRDNFSALPFDQEWLFAMSLLSETSVLLDEADRASVIYRLLLPWSSLNTADHAEGMRGSVSRYLGLLATTTQRWTDAEAHFNDAIEMNERIGARPWVAHTQTDYARMLLARDRGADRGKEADLISAAVQTYRELGMDSWARSAIGAGQAK